MSDPMDPREVLAVFFRHKKKATFAGLLVLLAAVAVTAIMQPRFRSEAMLFVRLGRENVALDPTASIGGGSVMAVPQGREDEINSVVEILKSRSLAEQTVDQVGPAIILDRSSESGPLFEAPEWLLTNLGSMEPFARRLLPGPGQSLREEALEKFAQRLTVSAPKRSTIVHVAFDAPSPAVAQQVLTQLIDLYLQDHVRLNRTAGSHDFFVEQTGQLKAQLLAAEARMRDLKNQTGMAAVEDQRKILVERTGRLEDDLLRHTTELTSLDAELLALNEKLDRLPGTRVLLRVSGLPNQAADLMRQQLYLLQLKEQDLLSTFKDDTRQVQEIRRQIAEAQGILAKEEAQRTQSTNSDDPTFQQLHLSLHSKQTQAASLRARIAKSREQLTQSRAELELLNDHEMHIVQMRREVAMQEDNYRKYAENLEQARIDQALKLERISNIGVVQPATLQAKQVRPQTALQLLAGLLASAGAAMAAALAAEYFDTTLKTADDVARQLDVVPLACIPHVSESPAKIAPLRERHARTRPR